LASLGERIRARRKELGLTQAQLGGRELTKGFISLVEKGRAKPSLETLLLLAQRLQQPVAYFLEQGSALGAKALRVTLASGWTTLQQGDYTRAAGIFQDALPLAQAQGDERALAECHIGLGSALANLRQVDVAREHIDRGAALAEASGAALLLVRVSHIRGLIAYYAREFRAAREHFTEGYRRFQEAPHPDVGLGGILLYNIGNTYMELGDHVEASRWYEQALEVLEPTEDLHRLGLVQLQLGVARRERGDFETALAHLGRAEHLFQALADTRLLGWAHNSIGITLLARGKVDEAIAHFETSLRIKERLGDDPGRARSLAELARAFVMQGRCEDADGALAEADRLATRFDDVTEAARIRFVRAQLQAARGQIPDAVREYKHAIAAFEALGMDADVARASNALGALLLERKRPSEAAPYLAKALHLLQAEPPR